MLRAYLPRLQMGGVEQLTLRFAVGDQPWTARFELTEAEYHSFEQGDRGARDWLRSARTAPAGRLRGWRCICRR
jgi:hypothetical protein